MIRFHIFKDGTKVADTFKKEAAVAMIKTYQKKETHPFLKASFSIIQGEEEFISYEDSKKGRKRKINN